MWYVNEDGQVKYGVLTDRFAVSTALLKTCYDEGLISKEFAADSDSALATQSWVSGKSGVLLYKGSPVLIQELLENDPTANPVPMPPFETEYGINAFHQSKLSNVFVMISSQAKYPEASIKYLDWLLEEGWFPLTYGLEDVHYTVDNNGYPVMIQGDEVSEQMRYSSAYVLLSQNQVTKESILASATKDEMSQAIAQLEVAAMELNASYTFRRDFPYDPDVSEYEILYADWSMIEQRLMAKAITGGSECSIDDMMQDLRAEWNALGGEIVEKKVQEWYNNNYLS